MLETDLLGRSEAEFAALGRPTLLALYSFRHDAHLVPALRENLTGLVDGFVAWDDRQSSGDITTEPLRRKLLLDEAKRLNADWALALDPDERLEPAAAVELRAIMARRRACLVNFRLREMFEPDAYRIDGIWGSKTICRMFPLAGMEFDHDQMHSSWEPVRPKLPRRESQINIYHLKMLTAERRQARRNLYAGFDPLRRAQAIGYDYLVDETGLQLERIPPERMFWPPHLEDGGLWMERICQAVADPPEARLKLASRLHKAGRHDEAEAALASMSALLEELDWPIEQRGNVLLQAGRLGDAEDVFAKALATHPRDAAVHAGLIHALGLQNRVADRVVALKKARRIRLQGDPLAVLRLNPAAGGSRIVDEFAAAGWVKGPVEVRWGKNAAIGSDFACVVIGLHAVAELVRAVDSLLSQVPAPLIIVVNSGRGDLAALLGARIEKVISASIPQRVYVGAARNVGAALAPSGWVGFLASDCIAEPGWVAARLRHHRAGAVAVSTALLPANKKSAISWAAHLRLYSRRMPDTRAELVLHFGLSYDRLLLQALGWFEPGMRFSEDTYLNAKLRAAHECVFAPEVATLHPSPERLIPAISDSYLRARRRTQYVPAMSYLGLAAPATALLGTYLAGSRWSRRYQRDLEQTAFAVGKAHLRFPANLALPVMIAILNAADFFGRLRELPAELASRRKARRIIDRARKGETAAAKDLLSQAGSDLRLGPAAALELAIALHGIGLGPVIEPLLRKVCRFSPTNSHMPSIEKLLAAINVPNQLPAGLP